MKTLGQLIDDATRAQYGSNQRINPLAFYEKQTEREKYTHEFLRQIKNAGLPEPAKEYRFHPVRLWRLDFAYPEKKIAVEIDGGGWGRVVVCHRCKQTVLRFVNGRSFPVREGGRHHTAKGVEADNEKKNALAELGWRVVTYNPIHIKNGSAISNLTAVLKGS